MQYDAVAFLDSLFRSPAGLDASDPAPARLASTPADLPPEWHLAWDERAAILEFEGGLPREQAEVRALAHILKAMEREGIHEDWSGPTGM
jgi:hypothetical protein